MLSYLLFGQKHDYKIMLTLVQICAGVSQTIISNKTSDNTASCSEIYGLIAIFFANLATASRTLFYKLYFVESTSTSNTKSQPSPYSFYVNISFVSFLLVLPFYLVKVAFQYIEFNESPLNYNADKMFLIGKYLLIGSVLNFAYNLISFKVLENVSSITHSIINIMKRMYVVFCSMALLSTKLTSVQLIGILIADSGCILYSFIKSTRSYAPFNSNTSNKRAKFTKKLILFMLISVLLTCFVHETVKTSAQNRACRANIKNENRIVCLNKIKQEIIDKFRLIIPNKSDVHLIGVPEYRNYGDTLIW